MPKVLLFRLHCWNAVIRKSICKINVLLQMPPWIYFYKCYFFHIFRGWLQFWFNRLPDTVRLYGQIFKISLMFSDIKWRVYRLISWNGLKSLINMIGSLYWFFKYVGFRTVEIDCKPIFRNMIFIWGVSLR